jgi:hypothetical protein
MDEGDGEASPRSRYVQYKQNFVCRTLAPSRNVYQIVLRP